LVVVVAILAVMSTIAVRMTTELAEDGRWTASQKQLDDIRTAILGPANDYGSDGMRIYSGFIADLGRVPKSTMETIPEYDNDNAHTLKELYSMPTNGPTPVAAYRLWQATSANINTSAALADTNVWIGVGWRGPYLRLGVGTTLIRDGWGEPILSTVFGSSTHIKNNILDSSGAGSSYIAPFDVMQVVAWGANRAAGTGDTGYDMDITMSYTTNEVLAYVNTDVTLMGVTNYTASQGNWIAQLIVFGPNPGTVGNTAASKPITVAAYSSAFTVYASTFTPTNILINFPVTATPYNATPTPFHTYGPRKMCAYYYRNSVVGTPATAYRRSAVRTVNFRPGDNFVSIAVDRP